MLLEITIIWSQLRIDMFYNPYFHDIYITFVIYRYRKEIFISILKERLNQCVPWSISYKLR